MVTCNNGHYYDQEKNATCPYCANNGGIDVQTKQTVFQSGGDDEERTALYNSPSSSDEEKTVYHSPSSSAANDTAQNEQDPAQPILLSGWLAVISEAGRGTSYTLTFGMNTIGRSEENHVSIQNGDSSISREKHALIIYDYANNLFFIKHGDGQFLSYVNGEVLLDTRQLKANDRIKVGSTELIFIPLCSDEFKWED
jgi:hypothetical protein